MFINPQTLQKIYSEASHSLKQTLEQSYPDLFKGRYFDFGMSHPLMVNFNRSPLRIHPSGETLIVSSDFEVQVQNDPTQGTTLRFVRK